MIQEQRLKLKINRGQINVYEPVVAQKEVKGQQICEENDQNNENLHQV